MELTAASVTRSLVLPVPADQVWASVRDAEGLAGWLGDAVDLAIVPGAAGTITEGGTVRRVVVTEVDEGRSIGLVWWDDAAPDDVSTVTIAVTPTEDGSTVTVTERLAGAASASIGGAAVGDLVGAAESAWDRRLQALVGLPARTDALV